LEKLEIVLAHDFAFFLEAESAKKVPIGSDDLKLPVSQKKRDLFEVIEQVADVAMMSDFLVDFFGVVTRPCGGEWREPARGFRPLKSPTRGSSCWNGIPTLSRPPSEPLLKPSQLESNTPNQWRQGCQLDHLRIGEALAEAVFPGLGLTKPHLTWEVPQKYFDLHPIGGIELPPITEGDLAQARLVGCFNANTPDLFSARGCGEKPTLPASS
jgi:hypothetical protein